MNLWKSAMLQLLITTIIALLVKSPRTVAVWSVLVPLFFLAVIATIAGGRFAPAAAVMVIACPMTAIPIHMLKTRRSASHKARKANRDMIETVRNKLKGNL